MPFLTISEAARLCGVNRRTLQRAVQAGRLPLTAEHRVDTADLGRAGYTVPMSQVTAPAPHGTAGMSQVTAPLSHLAPQGTPQDLTRLLTLLEAIAEDLHALRTRLVAPRTPAVPLERHAAVVSQADTAGTPHHVTPAPHVTPHDAAPVPHHTTLTPQEVTPVAAVPQGDAAPVPHHTTLTPQDAPHDVTVMSHVTPQEPATPEPATALPAHILRIAEVAAEYDKLTLVDLSQLLYDRGIYRSHDRTTGAEKPVHKGTLLAWLNKARQAGVL